MSVRLRAFWRGVAASSCCEEETGVDCREWEGGNVARMTGSAGGGMFVEGCEVVWIMKWKRRASAMSVVD